MPQEGDSSDVGACLGVFFLRPDSFNWCSPALRLPHTPIFMSSQVRTPVDYQVQPFSSATPGYSATGFHGLVPKLGCPQQGDREGIAMLPRALQPSWNSFVLGLILHSYSFDV